MSPNVNWAPLDRELGHWAELGTVATFWWRDDDAVRYTPALNRLLTISAEFELPMALAVIPSRVRAELAACLGTYHQVSVLQHGYAHRNHAPTGVKATEFDMHRPRHRIIDELVCGRERIGRLFPQQVLPILVPPWNRIDHTWLAELPRVGLTGLSTFRARERAEAVPGLRQVNCHVDLIDWRGARGFVGWAKALAEIVAHLQGRRSAQLDANEPTGLLTHHLQHDPDCWRFLEAFLGRMREHPAVRWVDAREAMWAA